MAGDQCSRLCSAPRRAVEGRIALKLAVDRPAQECQLLPFAASEPGRFSPAHEPLSKLWACPSPRTCAKEGPVSAVRIGVMHLAKCLEFKAVAVMACDDRYVPLQERIEAVADEVNLDAVYATECQLFYVPAPAPATGCTSAPSSRV
jgi:hypothetical protein